MSGPTFLPQPVAEPLDEGESLQSLPISPVAASRRPEHVQGASAGSAENQIPHLKPDERLYLTSFHPSSPSSCLSVLDALIPPLFFFFIYFLTLAAVFVKVPSFVHLR